MNVIRDYRMMIMEGMKIRERQEVSKGRPAGKEMGFCFQFFNFRSPFGFEHVPNFEIPGCPARRLFHHYRWQLQPLQMSIQREHEDVSTWKWKVRGVCLFSLAGS